VQLLDEQEETVVALFRAVGGHQNDHSGVGRQSELGTHLLRPCGVSREPSDVHAVADYSNLPLLVASTYEGIDLGVGARNHGLGHATKQDVR